MAGLLDGRFVPVTASIGLLERRIGEVVEPFTELVRQRAMDWQVSPPPVVERHPVDGSLADALRAILPLNSGEPHRRLLLPTAGPWTAFFDSGWRWGDPAPFAAHLATVLRCRSLVLRAIEPYVDASGRPFPGPRELRELTLRGPERTDWLNVIRSVSVVDGDEGWRFESQGTRLPFEDTDRYGDPVIGARLTFHQLDRYARALGAQPFDPGWYLPPNAGPGALIEVHGLPGREYSLEEARAQWLEP